GWEQQPQAGGAYDVAAKTNVLRARYPQLGSKPWLVLESGVWGDPTTQIPVRAADGATVYVTPNDDWQTGYPAKLFARGLSAGRDTVLGGRAPQLRSTPWLAQEQWVCGDPATQLAVPAADAAAVPGRAAARGQLGRVAKLFARGLSAGLSSVVWHGLRDQP